MFDMEQTTTNIVNDVDIRIEGIEAEELPFDKKEDRWGRLWFDKYGIVTKNLFIRTSNGELRDDRRFKGIFVDGKYRRVVSRYYTVFPNEEVAAFLAANAAEFGLEIRNTYKSHYGDAQYWELLSDEFDEHIDYKGKDDVVKIGCIVRNSLGANVSLGADTYTWRVFCENGAVGRGRDLGFALRHLGGDPEKLMNAFIKGIEKILIDSKELVEYYRKAASLRMNKKIASEISKRIPIRAFPDCMTYDYKTHSPVLLQEADLWKSFNDVTEKVWHPERFSNKPKNTGFANKATIEIALHSILKNAVDGKYNQ